MTTSHRRKFWTVLILLAGMAASMFAAGQWAWQHSLDEESDSVQRQLALYGQTLGQRIDRYRTLPEVLALDAQLYDALSRPRARRRWSSSTSSWSGPTAPANRPP